MFKPHGNELVIFSTNVTFQFEKLRGTKPASY